MRPSWFLTLLVATLGCICLASAEDDAVTKNVDPAAAGIEAIDNKIHRLKGRHKLTTGGNEERAILIAPVLAAHIVSQSHGVSSAQVSEAMVGAAKVDPMTFKKFLAILIGSGLGIAAFASVMYVLVSKVNKALVPE